MAPRVAVRCAGELASGTSVSDVVIGDMSVTGCGVEIRGAVEDVVEGTGVLSVRSPDGTRPVVLLPIVVCNKRVEDGRALLGLKFRPLSSAQVRRVIAVMHENGRDA